MTSLLLFLTLHWQQDERRTKWMAGYRDNGEMVWWRVTFNEEMKRGEEENKEETSSKAQ